MHHVMLQSVLSVLAALGHILMVFGTKDGAPAAPPQPPPWPRRAARADAASLRVNVIGNSSQRRQV